MPDELKVCLLNDSFPPVIDGVANVLLNYAKIIQGGLGSAVVATPAYPDAEDNYPFPVIRYPSVNTQKLVGYRAGLPFLPIETEEIRRMGVDIIHAHCPVASMLLARSVRFTANAPVVFTYHTKFDIDIAHAIESGVLQHVALKALVANIESADEVWTVSKGAGENLKSLGYRGSYRVMPNGVDFPRGRVDDGEIKETASRWGIDPSVPVLLFVGRMMWYKGLKTILDGLKLAEARGAKFRMIFVGGGGELEAVKKYAAKLGLGGSCVFTGPEHDRGKLRTWFCMADAFLFPSTFDTNGIVVREAAACGLGSVLIKESCAAEGVTDGRNGLLIEDDARSMCEAVMKITADRRLMRQIGGNAQSELYISWEDAVKTAYDRYGAVIEEYKAKKHHNISGLEESISEHINHLRQI